MKVKCDTCGKTFDKKKSRILRTKHNFCSKHCSNIAKESGKMFSCSECGKPVYRTQKDIEKSRKGLFFCCRSHAASYRNRLRLGPDNPNFNNGSYRLYALHKRGEICESRGFDEDVRLLDVHHIDLNKNNNDIENLKVLCVMCHARIHRRN